MFHDLHLTVFKCLLSPLLFNEPYSCHFILHALHAMNLNCLIPFTAPMKAPWNVVSEAICFSSPWLNKMLTLCWGAFLIDHTVYMSNNAYDDWADSDSQLDFL